MKRMKETIGRLAAGSLRWAALAIAIGLAGSTWAAAVGDTVTWTNADGLSASDVVNANHCSFSLQLPETAGLAKGSVVRITNVQIASINSQRVSNSSNNQNDPHSIAIGATRSSEVSFITSETLAGKYIDSYDFSNGVEVEVGKNYRESWGAKYDQFAGCGVTFLHSNGNRWSGGTTMNCTVGGTTSGAIANGTTVFPIYKITATVVAVAQNVERTIVANADTTWDAAEWTVGGVADQAFVPSSDVIYNVTVKVGGDCTVTMPASIGSFKTCNVNFVRDGSAAAANVTLKYSGTLPSDSATTANFSPFGSASVTAGESVTLMPVYVGSTEGYVTKVEGVNYYFAKRPDIGVVSVRIGARTAEAAGGNIDPSYSNVGPYPISGMLWNQTKLWNNNSTSGTYTDIQNLKDAKDGSSSVRIAYYGHNTYFNNNAATSPNMVLTKTYLDDSDSGNGNLTATDGNENITLPTPGHVRGWQLHFDNIPYNAYDVYFITASDVENGNLKETPIYVSLDGGATWKSYCGDSVNQKTVMGTDNWTGLPYAANGVLVHGKNYIKMRITKSIYGDNIGTIDITHGVRNTGSSIRSGLAAIQIVEVQNDGVYTLQESGNWSDAVWSVGSLTDQTWTDTVEGDASIAKIASSATVSSVNVDAAVSAGSVVLTGSEPFTVAGSSTLTVETGFDASAFTGSLNLQAPIAGTIYIGANTDLEFGGDTDMTLPAYTLDGAGAWQKVGSGKLTVNNPLTLAGTVNAGSLEFTSSTSGSLSLVGGNLVLAGGETELIYSGVASLADQGSGKTVVASGTVQSTGRIETDIDVEDGAKLKLGALRGFGSGGASVGSTPSGKTITIKQGGTIELNGTEGCNEYTLAGGTLQNSGNAIAVTQRQTMGLTLTDDSTVNAASNFGLVNNGYAAVTVTLNGNTLTKTGANTFILCNVSTDNNGAIEVAEGTMSFQGSASAISAPVTVAEGAVLDVTFASSVAAVDGAGSITGSATLTVTEDLALTDGLTVAAPIALADGATVTLGTGSITGAITVPDNASVTVDATDAVVAGTTTVLSSMTIGEGATIDVTNLPAGYAAQVTENSVVLVQMVTVTIPPVTGATLESVTCGGNDVSIVNGTVTVPAGSTITLNWAAEEGYIIGTTPTIFDVGTEDTTVSGTGLIETVQAVARANDTLCPSLAMAITVVPDGGTVTLLQPSSDNITLSNNKSIVFVENGKAFGGKLTGNGTITVNAAPTATTWSSARFDNGWTGTFVVGWDMSGKMMPDKYGITGSTVEVSTAVTSGYFNTDSSDLAAPSIAPALYFDKDVTISDGFGGSSSVTTFAKVGMAANKTFATRGNDTYGRDSYYTFTELNGFDGTLSVRANDHVTIGAVKTVGMPAANTVIVACTKTTGEILNSDGNDASVYPVDVTASVEFDNKVHEFPGKAVYATIGNASGLYYAVANIGDKYYATYAAAVADYTAGDTIVVSDATAGNVPTGWELTSEGTRLTKIQVAITWDVDGDQTVTYVDYGDTPSYTGETPTKTDTDEWDYEFTGWDKDFAPVTADVTYTAQFSATKKQYTLTVPVVENATATVTVSGVEQSGVAGEGETVYTFDYGTAAVVTYTADTYYSVTANGTQNFTLTGNDEAVAPTVTRNTVTVTVPSVDNATVSVQYTTGGAAATGTAADTYTIDQGTTVTVTYTADTGYFINGQASNTVVLDTVTTSTEITSQQAGSTTAAVAWLRPANTPYSTLMNGLLGLYGVLGTEGVYLEVTDTTVATPNEYGTDGIGYDAENRVYAKAVATVGAAGYLTVQAAIDDAANEAFAVLKANSVEALTLANNKTVTIIDTVAATTYTYTAPVPVTEGAYTIDATEVANGTTYTARDWYDWTVTVEADNAEVTGFTSPVSEASPDITFTVTAAATYKVTSVQVNGTVVGTTAGEYNATLNGNTTITVTTELDVVTFTVPALANATVTAVTGATPTGNANEYTATIGDAVTVTYTANDGYVFAGGATTTTVNWTAAAAEAPVAPASAPVVAVAKIGNTPYATLAAAVAAAQAGDTVRMIADETADATKTAAADRLVVTKAITIDFGAFTYTVPGELETSSNWSAFYIDANVTVTGTTGGINCLDKAVQPAEGELCGVYAFTVGKNVANVTLTINGGVYHGGGTVVQVDSGSVVVNGGTFSATPYVDAGYGMDFVFNCKDSNYKAGTAGVAINGGTFVGFDPQDNKSEGAGTDYTAPGYIAVDDGNGTFTVEEGYVITFADYDDTVLETLRVPAGETPAPTVAPTRADDVVEAATSTTVTSYAFDGWTVAAATEDATYTATYTATVTVTNYVAQIVGGLKYETLAAAIGAAQAGDTVALIADCTADAAKTTAADRLVVTKAITIDFGAYTYSVPGSLEPTANWCAIYIDANTTVTGTTGGVDCLDKEDPSDKCGVYAFNVRNGATLTIEGGHYHGGGTIVQAQLGTVEITGGTFTVTPFEAPYGMDFAFNCVDSAYAAGTAGFDIEGGTFVGFDPQDNKSEGAGTDYTADGFVAIDDGEGTFTVVEGYNVTYKNGDTVLETYRVAKAEPATPAYAGETPVKPADELYTYTFAGWDPAVAETVTEDATYAATFTPVAKYTTFTVAVPENTTVTVTGATLVEGNTYQAGVGAEVTITYAASGAYVASGTKTQKVTPTANQTVEPPSTYTVVPATVEFTNPSSVVTYYTESNLNSLNNGTYKLLADVTRTQRMAFGTWASSVTIDLNGFTLTSTASDCAITLGRAGTAAAPKVFNLVDTSAEKGGVLAFTTTPSSTTSAIRTSGKYNQVTIGEGVTVTGGCILMSGANQTLTVYGTVNGGEDFAIASQGDSTKDLTLTVAAGAVVSSSTTAVYLPGTGTATIAGTVTGDTGVEIRSGTLNVVDGAVITATGAFSEAANGSGTTVSGAAVAVSQHTTKNPISVTVSGGTLTGAKALYETDVQNGEETTDVAMAVTGGTFEGAVESDDVTGFVSGGTFSAPVPEEFCAAGYEPKDNGDSTYGVQTAKVEVETDEDDPTPTTAEPVTVLVAVPKACAADELIDTANRAEGDILKAYVKGDDRFYTWELKSTGAWEPKETYKVDESGATVSTKPAAEVNLTAGQSVWVTIKTDETIKLLVTYNPEPVAVEVDTGWNMVAPTTPGGTTVKEIAETSGATVEDAIVVPTKAAPKVYTKDKTTGEWGFADIKEVVVETDTGTKKRAIPFRNTADTTIKAGKGVWFVNGGNNTKQINL